MLKVCAAMLCVCVSMAAQAQIGINTKTPQAALDVVSDTSAVLLPRNAAPAANVTTPVEGMMIYNSAQKVMQYYNGSQWVTMEYFCPGSTNPAHYVPNEGTVTITASTTPAVQTTNGQAYTQPTITWGGNQSGGEIPVGSKGYITYGSGLVFDKRMPWPQNDIANQWNDAAFVVNTAQVYDSVQNPITLSTPVSTFLPNPVEGQLQIWRLTFEYTRVTSGAGTAAPILARMQNNVFSCATSASLSNPAGVVTLALFIVSLPESEPNQSGYTLEMWANESNITLRLINVTRFSVSRGVH
ncbi:MAG: hypothetical protein LBU90_05480 [Bacteroidales bacterium]|nr:hypothetical protein [Bacteroidales bacterium]